MDCNLHLECRYVPAILCRWFADTTFSLQPDLQDLEPDEEMDTLLTTISNLQPLCVTRDYTVPNAYGETEYTYDVDTLPMLHGVEEVD